MQLGQMFNLIWVVLSYILSFCSSRGPGRTNDPVFNCFWSTYTSKVSVALAANNLRKQCDLSSQTSCRKYTFKKDKLVLIWEYFIFHLFWVRGLVFMSQGDFFVFLLKPTWFSVPCDLCNLCVPADSTPHTLPPAPISSSHHRAWTLKS